MSDSCQYVQKGEKGLHVRFKHHDEQLSSVLDDFGVSKQGCPRGNHLYSAVSARMAGDIITLGRTIPGKL